MRVLAVLYGLAAALASVSIANAQTGQTFREVTDAAAWPSRGKANVEYVKKQSTFKCYNDISGRQPTWSVNSYFLMYGGESRTGAGTNDVWVGKPNGVDWCFASGVTAERIQHPTFGDVSFAPNRETAHCQDSNFRQYRVGGLLDNVITSDVWTSADGVSWQQVTDDGGFDPRYFASLVADSNNRLVLTGGILDGRKVSDETWQSRDQGKTWSKMTSKSIRPQQRGVAVLLSSGSIWNTDPVLLWLTGVDTEMTGNDNKNAYMQDVWASSDSGRVWTAVTLSASFGRRDDSNAEITPGGMIVLAGGYNGGTGEHLNDVWVSANGGYSWGACVIDADWEDRRYLHTVLDDEGYLWVMGGQIEGLGYQNDIWKSVISYHDNDDVSQHCGVSIPSCGVGLKCWPGKSETLVSTDGRSVYCSECPYSFGSGSATVVTGFLVFFVILFILAAGTLGYALKKLRDAGTASPIPLPGFAQSWWNKSAAASVDGSTDSGSNDLYQALRLPRDTV